MLFLSDISFSKQIFCSNSVNHVQINPIVNEATELHMNHFDYDYEEFFNVVHAIVSQSQQYSDTQETLTAIEEGREKVREYGENHSVFFNFICNLEEQINEGNDFIFDFFKRFCSLEIKILNLHITSRKLVPFVGTDEDEEFFSQIFKQFCAFWELTETFVKMIETIPPKKTQYSFFSKNIVKTIRSWVVSRAVTLFKMFKEPTGEGN
ncbi:hypothetical protein CDIK_4220 [Cucumispora dikerogammari]|nr:hypothetical protein CDIK_4220 [Cucumispora dikerogammari]